MKRAWQRVHKFISEPKYEYVCRSNREFERIKDDVPMVELRRDDDDNDDTGSAGVTPLITRSDRFR